MQSCFLLHFNNLWPLLVHYCVNIYFNHWFIQISFSLLLCSLFTLIFCYLFFFPALFRPDNLKNLLLSIKLQSFVLLVIVLRTTMYILNFLSSTVQLHVKHRNFRSEELLLCVYISDEFLKLWKCLNFAVFLQVNFARYRISNWQTFFFSYFKDYFIFLFWLTRWSFLMFSSFVSDVFPFLLTWVRLLTCQFCCDLPRHGCAYHCLTWFLCESVKFCYQTLRNFNCCIFIYFCCSASYSAILYLC